MLSSKASSVSSSASIAVQSDSSKNITRLVVNIMITSKSPVRLPRAFLVMLVSSLILLAVLSGKSVMAIEEPAYHVVEQIDKIEIREYAPYLVAETLVEDEFDRNAAVSKGFRRLFRYISGDNSTSGKITMTAPVLQSKQKQGQGRKISMTAPVQQTRTPAGWRIAFVLPADFSLDTAPVPEDDRIQILQSIPSMVAAIRFNGGWSEANYSKHRDTLVSFLELKKLKMKGEPMYAAYNSPFSLPFMRRNEVLVEIMLDD